MAQAQLSSIMLKIEGKLLTLFRLIHQGHVQVKEVKIAKADGCGQKIVWIDACKECGILDGHSNADVTAGIQQVTVDVDTTKCQGQLSGR